MTLGKWTMGSMLVTALFAAGCGADCESYCQEDKDCEASTLRDVPCPSYCDTIESINEKAGCEDQFDEMISCRADQDDACSEDAETACEAENKAYTNCQADYCIEHRSECDKLTN